MGELRLLGPIERLQIQTGRLIDRGGYSPDRIESVHEAALSAGGMVGFVAGAWVLDVHHPAHPDSGGKLHRAVSVGFTSHYEKMRQRFGAVAAGVAGENIIVASDRPIGPDEVAAGLVVTTAQGEVALEAPRVAAPCAEFTSFLLGRDDVARRDDIADELNFLAGGTRGFVSAVSGGPLIIRPGDQVWRRSERSMGPASPGKDR